MSDAGPEVVSTPRLTFRVEGQQGRARAGRVELVRGAFETPVFMPVGTQGTVKAMRPEDLEGLDARILLANGYHLYLRPGTAVIERCGGLHRFIGWDGLILTDSGGYQIFSLRSLMRIDDQGVAFRSHIDGSAHTLGPEQAMSTQAALGSDIAMAFDQCPPSEAPRSVIVEALRRTTAWAERSVRQPRPPHQARFGIIQGGLDATLRLEHLAQIGSLPFEGLALGGLSVGERPEQMHALLGEVAHQMPAERPRYLMGVGRPEDLVVAIGEGIDMFDCVMPTRNARNGQLFTSWGRIVISHSRYRDDVGPVDPACSCATCQRYTRAYLRHLYQAREILYSQLATLHNLHYTIQLVRAARQAILDARFPAFVSEFFAARQ